MKTNNKDKMIEEANLAVFISFVEEEAKRIDEERRGLRRRDGGRKMQCLIFMRQFLTKHEEAVVERIKDAFYEEFAGSGEIWFPYIGCGAETREEELEAVDEYWESIIGTLPTPYNPTSNNK